MIAIAVAECHLRPMCASGAMYMLCFCAEVGMLQV